MNRWISIKDELPPDRLWVLVRHSHGLVDRACLAHNDHGDDWYLPLAPVPADQAHVTHWMYIPEYTEKDNEC